LGLTALVRGSPAIYGEIERRRHMSVVTEVLERRGVPFEAIHHAKTFTSLEEAEAIGVDADDVLKTVILDTAEGHAVVVVPGSHRLDMLLVEQALGDRTTHLATEDELRRDFPEFELGAFPPLGSAAGIPTYVDPEVFAHDRVVFAAGSESESLRARSTELFREEPVVVTPLSLVRAY
jgi:Ala-tRNA(Pro) deacylase